MFNKIKKVNNVSKIKFFLSKKIVKVVQKLTLKIKIKYKKEKHHSKKYFNKSK